VSRRAKLDPSVVAAYARVSRVGGRAGDGFISFDDQEDGIRRRARELGLTIPDDGWFREPDASGGSFRNRPKWDEMMARIEDPDDPLAGFIAVRTDRFSRNVAEGAAVAEQLKRGGRNFILVDVPVDFSTPEGELMFTQMLAYAQYQLRYLQAGWWRSKKRAIGRGAHIGRTPSGFRRIPKDAPTDSGKLVPLDEWRVPIERLFRYADEHPHLGDGALASWANDHNPRPDGKRWYPGMVGRMLANPVYLGRIAYRPRKDTDVVWSYDPLANTEAHDAVIDEGLFLRVQMKRVPRQPTQQLDNQRPKEGREPALLQGLLRCAGCQHLLKPSMAGKRVPVYHCDGGKHRSSGVCPSPSTIARHLVEPHVISQVLAADEAVLARLVARQDVDEVAVRAAEQALIDAREDLDAIRKNTRMAARNYDRWEETVEHAERAVREAQAAYDGALTAGPAPPALPREFKWEDLSVSEQRALIAGAMDCAFVRSGRGLPPERRTLILWKGQAAEFDLDLPGKGRPAKRPAAPIEWDDSVGGVAVT
jgi:DNA invertase Pin-like site-specific DNA recombinase